MSESDLKLWSFLDLYHLHSTQKDYLVPFSQRSWCIFIAALQSSYQTEHPYAMFTHAWRHQFLQQSLFLHQRIGVCWSGLTRIYWSLWLLCQLLNTSDAQLSSANNLWQGLPRYQVYSFLQLLCLRLDQAQMSGTVSQRDTAIQRLPVGLVLEAELLLLHRHLYNQQCRNTLEYEQAKRQNWKQNMDKLAPSVLKC